MRQYCIALVASALACAPQITAGEMETYRGCALVATAWADGDSFLVEFPDGAARTVRLYGADCLEWHVTDATDARRLRSQRRYFGISNYGGDPALSIATAKQVGEAAALAVRELLQERFIVHTAHADARGDGKHERIYGFVELSDGRDLGEVLVESGLARAFGVYRERPGVQTGEEYREKLVDLELKAAKLGTGVWKFTDWDALPGERKQERQEESELEVATDQNTAARPTARTVDPNTAPRDLLMQLPGIGEGLANRIIEGRSAGRYENLQDLQRVPGIGDKTIERIREFLIVPTSSAGDDLTR